MITQKILFTIGLLCFSILTFGQGLFEESTKQSESKLEINGYTRGVIVGGSENYDISNAFAEFCIKPKFSKNKTHFFADLRIREGYLFNKHKLTIEPKELYVAFKSKSVDVILGNHIVTWGRTDGFNPTNIVTPTDYFFITPEPDDQKVSNFILRSKIHLTPEIDLDLIGIPFYKPSVYRYDLFLSEDNVEFVEPKYPSKEIKNGSLAAQINFELPSIGFSFSYISGFSPFSGFGINSIDWNTNGTINISNIVEAYRHHTIGADLALPIKSIILRAEAAYQQTTDYATNMSIPNPNLSYVGGIEFNIGGYTTILQYVGKFTFDYKALTKPILKDPTNPLEQMAYAENLVFYESEDFNRKAFDQQEESNHALMLSLNKDFLYNSFNAEVTGYYNITSESFLIRPMIKYKIDDNLTVKIGGSYMHGPFNSIFAYSSPVLNGIIISLKANF